MKFTAAPQTDQNSNLFTVVLQIDDSLRITSISPLIGRYAPEIFVGQALNEAFEFFRPTNVTAQNLKLKLQMIFLMIARESRYPIRGQMIKNRHTQSGFILLGSPWLSRLMEDNIHQYEISDFPLHDAQLDWQFMLSAKKQQVKDLERLSKDLAIAKAKADAAIESKSAFFAVMSHEMRTPLNAITGAINLMPRDLMNTEQTDLLTIAVNGAQQLLSVINNVLDFSKMEAGKMELELTLFTLSNLIKDVTSIVSPKAHSKNLQLKATNHIKTDDIIQGDDGKIKQILLNLISNAVKFTEAGSVCVDIHQLNRQDKDLLVRISVKDTGPGIANENKDRLFEQFWTSSIAKGFAGSGTGLGLNIAKQMTEKIGGKIAFESTLGVGSTFWIDIPLTLSDQAVEQISMPIPNIETARNGLSNKRVLVAEDNQANQIIARLTLEKMGIIVDIANNGLEVIEAMKTRSYDAVLMDIGMPEMTGIEAIKIIRNELQLHDLPVIACTAHSLSTERSTLKDNGFSDYIAKPIDIDNLINTLLKWIGNPGAEIKTAQPVEKSAQIIAEIVEPLVSMTTLNRLENDIGAENMAMALKALTTEIESRGCAIRAAGDDRDLHRLGEEAHALKSCALSFGASKLGEQVKRMEELANAGDDTALELVSSVIQTAEDTQNAFSKVR